MVLFLVCIEEISLAQSIDTEAPVISCPFNITVNATPGVCGAVVNYSSPAATDNSSSDNLPTSISGYAFKGDYNGHTYFMSNSMATPETAHANAIALGGHLVTINSAAENAFVSAMSPYYMWIGYTDRDVEGTFRWITDEPVTYTNWAPGEPNNAGNEDWAVINWGGSAMWNDWYYTVSAYYVVEFSGGSVPTTLLSGLGSGATFPIGISTETWQATDPSGNVSTCSFTVTVVDNIAPTVVAQNITVQLNSSGTATITAAQVNNGSTDNCGIASIVVSKTAFNCSNVGANTVTLTVTDVNGNVSTGTAVVTV
ncbi:MAG: HYR domain-containing protein, partial [Bacteroidota bacterium]|nr:HYR domain-containing protein [Bacteroidota bacterium]